MIRLILLLFAVSTVSGQSNGFKLAVQSQDVFGTTAPIYNTESGLGEWHWHDITVSKPNIEGTLTDVGDKAVTGMRGTEEYGDDQILTNPSSNRITFFLDPNDPPKATFELYSGYNGVDEGNKRAEVNNTNASGLFDPNNAYGTIEWIGFNAQFPSDYVKDTASEWIMLQSKGSDSDSPGNISPPIALFVMSSGFHGATDAEFAIHNIPNGDQYALTGVVPEANGSYDIVLMIEHHKTAGAVKMWINGVLVANDTGIATVYSNDTAGAGTLKFGVYKYLWGQNITHITDSEAVGVFNTSWSMGPLKIHRSFPGDAGHGEDKYSLVAP